MLKALELIGFKSFADKTRFEFPQGITVVVGPNGSGKSNVVDAIKWVLGEQSAKSLRGKEMTDVIFKGTGESGRKALNAAEVTIIFDNSSHRLPFDAEEVHVTRRVYRSGEGEYLINGLPSRLKDIRDMFRGTGVGTDAYSLIEQGKVDQMLQASAKDRRAIFEEAAGISRFKAKKAETQRRLERIEQNLLRLKDIVDEIEHRLRAVRSQASKARKYRECSERLQQLRTYVGASDWRQLTVQVETQQRELDALRVESSAMTAEIDSLTTRTREVEEQLPAIEEAIRLCDNRLARQYEGVVSHETAIEQNRTRCDELEEMSQRFRAQLASITGRAGGLRERLREATSTVDAADVQHRDTRQRVADFERRLSEITRLLDERRSEIETRRTQHAETMRRSAVLAGRQSGLESQLIAVRQSIHWRRKQWDELLASVAATSLDLDRQQQAEQQLDEQLDLKRRLHVSAEQEALKLREQVAGTRQQLAGLQHRLAASRERADVLAELERNREGLNDGVREVLQAAQTGTEPWHNEIEGLVADILHVGVDVAPLIDIALGEVAQHVVLNGNQFVEALQAGQVRPPGRVGFALVNEPTPRDQPPDIERRKGILGRADRMVRCDVRFRSLVHRLLGDTWLVDSLTLALALRVTMGRGCRFVTATGELVEPQGTILVGPRNPVAGLVSRRNELRALQTLIVELDEQVTQAQQVCDQQQELLTNTETAIRQLQEEQAQAASALAAQRASLAAAQQRLSELEAARETLAAEMAEDEARELAAQSELDTVRGEFAAVESELMRTQSSIRIGETQLDELDATRQRHVQEANAARVDLARTEQQLDTLRERMVQIQEDERDRSRAILDAHHQLSQCLDRLQQAERDILQSTSCLAELYLAKESAVIERARCEAQRNELSLQRSQWTSQAQPLRRKLQQTEDQLHRKELGVRDLDHQRTALAERLREEYDVDIRQVSDSLSAEQQSARDDLDSEIAELRRKLNQLGSVNMESLAELDELEARFNSLNGQYQDLVQAKESLEKIIQRINADSRRLFQETLEAIRINFQGLYRKAFGGGRADIVLEEGVDPLEAGVDLLATPPGKPQFSNSLLSGGEKALTAVALLLAIFQFRPSPFCVLDEVDAPFDEANIGRFVDVLKGFLDWTKFVIVSHSKKTMTAATTLYGVTMQESGVSKRVSVRFEDVGEDGHIDKGAVDRDSASDATRKAA